MPRTKLAEIDRRCDGFRTCTADMAEVDPPLDLATAQEDRPRYAHSSREVHGQQEGRRRQKGFRTTRQPEGWRQQEQGCRHEAGGWCAVRMHRVGPPGRRRSRSFIEFGGASGAGATRGRTQGSCTG